MVDKLVIIDDMDSLINLFFPTYSSNNITIGLHKLIPLKFPPPQILL